MLRSRISPTTFKLKKEFDKLTTEEKEEGKIKLGDEDIINKLTTESELNGLLNWSLEGLNRLLNERGFSKSETTKDIERNWLRKSDSFNAFCMDCLEENYEGSITKVELRKSYSDYCRKFKLKSSTDKGIKFILSERFGASEEKITNKEGIRVNCWNGLTFVQGVQDVKGISNYRENKFFTLGSKQGSRLDTLDTYTGKHEEIIEDPLDFDSKLIKYSKCNIPDCSNFETNEDFKGKNYCKNHWDEGASK